MRSAFLAALPVGFAALLCAGSLGARTLTVTPSDNLQAALAMSRAGDTVRVVGGHHQGHFKVSVPMTLAGENSPILDGGGHGTVLAIDAPDVTVRGFHLRGSGDSLDMENSGIVVLAPRARVENNTISDALFGIFLRKADDSVLRSNQITGKDLDVPRRGDLIRIWYSNGVTVEDNTLSQGRDAVLWYSQGLKIRRNRALNSRYGLHFMYCDDADIEGNTLSNNSVGIFLMYSRRLRLVGNTIASNRGPSGYGVGLKDMDDALIENNALVDNRIGIHTDSSPREIDSIQTIARNLIAYNDVGISILPDTQRNYITTNSFLENGEQVQVAGSGQLQGNIWAERGRGNYWSDYAGYDRSGRGVGEVPYRSESLFENLTQRAEVLKVLAGSPFQVALDFAARAFPVFRPAPKLTDPNPLMTPVLPQGVPALPRKQGRGLAGTATGLMLALVAIAGLPRAQKDPRRPRRLRTPTADPLIEVEALTKRFGAIEAVKGVSFAVRQGDVVALWGPNGAGKTTVLRCLLGLFPFSGQVRVVGVDMRSRGRLARRFIGFVPQELSFHDRLSTAETLEMYARLKHAPLARVKELLETLGLMEHHRKSVRALSGGLKQRLALACALLSDPPILLLDEPTSNLDQAARDDFLSLLSDLSRAGKTLVFTSHRPEEVESLATRIILMENGKIVRDTQIKGTPSEAVTDADAHSELKDATDILASANPNECGLALEGH